MHRLFCFSHILILSTLLICQNSEASSGTTLVDNWSAFEEKLDSLRKEKRIPGLAVAVVSDGKVVGATGFGFADSNNEIPVTPNTPFWIASISKTFVGLAYLQLEAQGKVNFDEVAAKTPKFTGLCEWLAGTDIAFAERLDCSSNITIQNILNHQVNGVPGTEFMYNPIMYSRLSRHLEHKLGEGVDEVEGRHNFLGQWIEQSILRPAGMNRTMASMWDRNKMEVYFDLADGFAVDENGNKTKLRRPDKHIAGGAGVVSTVLDLAKYEAAINTGSIASSKVLERVLKPETFNDGRTSPYGYGWYFQCHRTEKLMWHGGWDPDAGYSGLLLRLPERDLAVAILANSGGMWWGNPLDKSQVESSEFASLFLDEFVFTDNYESPDSQCQEGAL